jgi:N-formylmaleamate deformylase
MAEFKQGDVKIDGIKIHYYRTGGEKPPFVLLHGATDNGLCWGQTAQALAEQYDVIMPDAQGHGLSDRLDAKFSFESHTRQAAGLIKELGLKKQVIMGHSMGAGTAANIAVEYPTLPKAIVLEDPPWAPPGPPPEKMTEEEKKEAANFGGFLVELGKRSLEEIIAQGKKMDPGWTSEERLYWAKAKQQFDPTLFKTMVINPRSYDEIIPKIKCPTLLIIAENGIVSKEVAENAARLWKAKKPFKWVQIKGATHNIRRDKYSAFKKALLDWLKTLDEGRIKNPF